MTVRIRVAVVLLRDSKILMVEHQKDGKTYWLLPGGGLNYGEKIEECARREIKEETNLDISIGSFLFLSESIAPDGSRHLLNLFFLGEISGGSLKVGEDIRLKSVAFKDFEELDTLEVHPPMGKLLKQILMDGRITGLESREKFLGNMWTS
ncbi:MAG: NUDIX domain-containing protein [Candidatus Xenobiia bacterium LiM19]